MSLVYFQCFLIPHPETAVFGILESVSAVYFAVCLSVGSPMATIALQRQLFYLSPFW